ncbi:platelet-activating factor acetylhydrolase IB subunit beta homolog [Alosa alosa]|uniref:platelet-activating factor acetylhydrolase IB subunit beta homolog n=1 Tax=Alosa alosa TaxID=278164 RepID=UPI002015104C|nr:platelet-activating factor acetylhydrolase IB subunit beta homolog [Alosa alosa]
MNAITELRETLKSVQEENYSLPPRSVKPSPPLPLPSPTPDPGPDQEKKSQHIAILMDSNRRFLDLQRLFPKHKVTVRPCSTTEHAQQLLRKDALGNPQCIIIHTGTNDLHTLGAATTEALMKVAEKASREFPASHIVILTLLPRRDTTPHVINGINAEISRRCATLPNVHLAHNPTISLRDMYDGIHLHQQGVRSFAKTLKDAVLGRNPSSTSFVPPPRPPLHKKAKQCPGHHTPQRLHI